MEINKEQLVDRLRKNTVGNGGTYIIPEIIYDLIEEQGKEEQEEIASYYASKKCKDCFGQYSEGWGELGKCATHSRVVRELQVQNSNEPSDTRRGEE